MVRTSSSQSNLSDSFFTTLGYGQLERWDCIHAGITLFSSHQGIRALRDGLGPSAPKRGRLQDRDVESDPFVG